MFVRASFRRVGDEDDRLRFDLSLDPSHMPLPIRSYFGYWGSFQRAEEGYGVLLTPGGIIDIGYGGDLNDRYCRTNILERKIKLGEYVTVYWKVDGVESESIYVIEAVINLIANSSLSGMESAERIQIESMTNLPRFRARVVRSFDIYGYDNTIYRPPVGIMGDIARCHDSYIFCPDGAFSKSGQRITVFVDGEDLEIEG